MNYGLIVSSVSAHSFHGTKHGFPLRHKWKGLFFFFYIMTALHVFSALARKHTVVVFE